MTEAAEEWEETETEQENEAEAKRPRMTKAELRRRAEGKIPILLSATGCYHIPAEDAELDGALCKVRCGKLVVVTGRSFRKANMVEHGPFVCAACLFDYDRDPKPPKLWLTKLMLGCLALALLWPTVGCGIDQGGTKPMEETADEAFSKDGGAPVGASTDSGGAVSDGSGPWSPPGTLRPSDSGQPADLGDAATDPAPEPEADAGPEPVDPEPCELEPTPCDPWAVAEREIDAAQVVSFVETVPRLTQPASAGFECAELTIPDSPDWDFYAYAKAAPDVCAQQTPSRMPIGTSAYALAAMSA